MADPKKDPKVSVLIGLGRPRGGSAGPEGHGMRGMPMMGREDEEERSVGPDPALVAAVGELRGILAGDASDEQAAEAFQRAVEMASS